MTRRAFILYAALVFSAGFAAFNAVFVVVAVVSGWLDSKRQAKKK